MTPHQPLTFIQALESKLKEIDNPDKDIITHEGYKYSLRYVARYNCKLPWITFTPYGSDTRIKAEIMRSAGIDITDQHRQNLQETRQEHNISTKPKTNNRMLADRFRQKWNSYWFEISKAIEALQDPQQRFARPGETVAEPIQLMMTDTMPGLIGTGESSAPAAPIKPEPSYADELDALN